jgi:signal transduction histidine kinase
LQQIALDRLPEAVVIVDGEGRVTACNDRARVVLGLTPAAVGRPITEVLELRDDTGDVCGFPPKVDAVGTRIAERVLQVVDHTGRQRPVSVTARWHADGWTLTARPAGRREILERMRGDVVATVSHEIRSPLSSVKGFTRTLLARWDRFDDERKRAMLETIDADADRVTRLLMDLLEVSRIDAGRVRLRRSPIDLAELVSTVVEKARHREDGFDRELVVERDDDLPLVPADRDRIEQVLTNLVDNALRYASLGPVSVSVRRAVDGVRVTVADRGPGIPDELGDTIFQKFGRGRDERRPGTGLGLYIGRGLAQAHGGRLWLEPIGAANGSPVPGTATDTDADAEGPGATFHLWLPTDG